MSFDACVDEYRNEFVDELKAFCTLPNGITSEDSAEEMAERVRKQLVAVGAEVRLHEVFPGAPKLIYASLRQETTLCDGQKTLLVYNHYDVVPAGPLASWHSPPFEPSVRDGRVFGRGIVDNRGHLIGRLQAIRAWRRAGGRLPCSINWLIEGEEEQGSRSLRAFCQTNPQLLKAEGCLWEMGGVDIGGRPNLDLGNKGRLQVELRVRTAPTDQNVVLDPLVPNAAWRLNWALSSLKSADETILMDGFAEQVARPSDAEWALLENIPFDHEQKMACAGVSQWLGGMTGTAALQRLLYSPTCTICSIRSGPETTWENALLPATAQAMVSFGLVPNLDPLTVAQLLRRHLDRHGFSDVEVKILGGEPPGRTALDAHVVRAAVAAARDVRNGEEPIIYPWLPGSPGPVWPVAFAHGVPLVSFGAAYPNSSIHAANENLRLDDYFQAIRMMGRFLASFANVGLP